MYKPKHFEITEGMEISRFIESNAFAQMTSFTRGSFELSHLPFLLSKDKTKLFAHIAKANPQSENIDGKKVLVSFQGPHSYVSPTWYSSHSTSKVPTWNYQAALVHGQCSVFDDDDRLQEIINKLSEKYEAQFPTPWIPTYPLGKLRGIRGIEISIDQIECKYKLSQNRSSQERKRIVSELKKLGAGKLATAMESLKNIVK